MSFDVDRIEAKAKEVYVSIPFEQGDVFRPDAKVSVLSKFRSLNPFRTGRCLSTVKII